MKYTPIGIIVDKSRATKRFMPELAPYQEDSLVYASNFERDIGTPKNRPKGKISRILKALFE
jgi:hypothetical protein